MEMRGGVGGANQSNTLTDRDETSRTDQFERGHEVLKIFVCIQTT
jgi:hypothetical protein